MSRIFKPFVFFLAGIYFLMDAAVWCSPARHPMAGGPLDFRPSDVGDVAGPYATLALFIVPVLILEPAKPLAAYLTATGHMVGGLIVLGVAEFLKLVLVERLFRISRDN